MRNIGYKIRQIGQDRNFAGECCDEMKAAHFNVVDQPQYTFEKSRGFRRIEKAVKDGNFYYLHSDAFEYCVMNVRAIEKTTRRNVTIALAICDLLSNLCIIFFAP